MSLPYIFLSIHPPWSTPALCSRRTRSDLLHCALYCTEAYLSEIWDWDFLQVQSLVLRYLFLGLINLATISVCISFIIFLPLTKHFRFLYFQQTNFLPSFWQQAHPLNIKIAPYIKGNIVLLRPRTKSPSFFPIYGMVRITWLLKCSLASNVH